MPSTLTPTAPDTRRDEYQLHGFVTVPGLFSKVEMDAAAAEAERLRGLTDLIDSKNLRCRWQPHAVTGECLFETFDPVIDISPVCAALARDPRMLAVVADLYGEPGHLFKDKLIFKPPGARGYDLHQDFIAWPGFPRSFLTAVIAIDPAGADNGATEVFPGIHRRGYLSPDDGNYHPLDPTVVGGTTGVVLDLAPGDVAFFGCLTPHRSAPNRSDRWRRLLYVSYNADSDGGDRRAAHYREFHAWLRQKYAAYGKNDTYFR
jgi:hypothetical protein